MLGKPLSEVNWSDLESHFEARQPENTVLDYKREIPKDLPKTIAALANTHGGIIFIGIAEDSDWRPMTPITGIPSERGLAEKIINQSVTAIDPPVVPEVVVVPNDSTGNVIVIVNVPPSVLAPHAIAKNTQVYIRTGNRNDPTAIADRNRIAWMENNRKKSIDLANDLGARSDQRWTTIFKAATQAIEPAYWEQSWLNVTCAPIYPSAALTSPPELRRRRHDFTSRDLRGEFNDMPYTGGRGGNLTQESVYFSTPGTYFEANIFGGTAYAFKLMGRDDEPPLKLPFHRIVMASSMLLHATSKLHSLLAFSGPVVTKVTISNTNGSRFALDRDPEEGCISIDDSFNFEDQCQSYQLPELIPEIAERLAQSISWAHNYDLPEGAMANFIRTRLLGAR